MTDEGAVPSGSWQPLSAHWSWDPAANAAARAEVQRERVPAGPGWLPLAAASAAVVAAVALPDAAPGLGVAVTAVAIAIALVPAMRGRLSIWTIGAGGAAVALAGMSAVRDAEWIVVLDLLAAFGLGSIVLAGGATFRDLLRGAASVVLAAPMAAAFAGRPALARLRHAPVRRSGPVVRAAVVSAVLLVVFGALFSSADKAFGSLTSRLVPSVSLGAVPASVVVFVLVFALVSAGAVVALGVSPVGISAGLHRLADAMLAPLDPRASVPRTARIEWMLPLVLLNLLFAAFVAVQFAVFFGGREHLISTPGLTAAEYARSGFFQLLTVCLLTLGVVAGAVRWVDADERFRLRLLLGPLCALTGVVLVSAWRRLQHYEEAFGYTRLRLLVAAVMAVIAVILVLVVVAGVLWQARWLPRAALVTAVATLFTLNVVNADGLIARRNIDRAAAGAELDTWYLAELSADAVPQLQRLPEPDRSCVLGDMADRLRRLDDGWRSANVSRARARPLVAGQARPAACASAGPYP